MGGLSGAHDLGEDVGSLGGLDERFRVLIVVGDVISDGLVHFRDAGEAASANAMLLDVAKKSLHQVEQDELAGVKWAWKRGCLASHRLTVSCLWVA